MSVNMKILGGLSHRKFAIELASNLNCQYAESHITTFDDSETRVQIIENLQESDVVIVQSTCKPVNNRLMELLLLIDTAKRSGAKRIIVVMPYFGYSRQDRRSYNFAPISARLVASLLEVSGADRVITVDLHSRQSEGFFKIPIQNLDPISLFKPIIERYNNSVIISPDIGGFVRVRNINDIFDKDIAVINKSRKIDNQCHMSEVIGNVLNKHCLLIDDIVDSGRTLCQAASLLIDRGALSVNAFITHPVLSNMSKENIQNSNINNIYITNTIETGNLPSKFCVISVLPIIAEALKKFIRI